MVARSIPAGRATLTSANLLQSVALASRVVRSAQQRRRAAGEQVDDGHVCQGAAERDVPGGERPADSLRRPFDSRTVSPMCSGGWNLATDVTLLIPPVDGLHPGLDL